MTTFYDSARRGRVSDRVVPTMSQLNVQSQILDSPGNGLRGIRARNGVADPPVTMPSRNERRR